MRTDFFTRSLDVGRHPAYVAGPDAVAAYATRRQLGDEAFCKAIGRPFFG
jgi:hypothetical protein